MNAQTIDSTTSRFIAIRSWKIFSGVRFWQSPLATAQVWLETHVLVWQAQ